MDIFGIGLPELLLVLVLALIVFGPDRLPKIARDLGRTIGDFRREAESIRQEFVASMETVQGPMQDSLNEMRSALSLNPARPAPQVSPYDNPLPPVTLDEEADEGRREMASLAPPPAPAAPVAGKFTPAVSTVSIGDEETVNSVDKLAAARLKQGRAAKPLPAPPAVEDALAAPPPAPAPSIEPSSVPSIEPSSTHQPPVADPPAAMLNPLEDEFIIDPPMIVGEAAILPDAPPEPPAVTKHPASGDD